MGNTSNKSALIESMAEQPAVFDYQQDHLLNLICDALEKDAVALVRNVPLGGGDQLMSTVCRQFDLLERLKLQAGHATMLGHRDNVGQYFMTVNKRDSYQFVAAHSEASHVVGMQIASLYCAENNTDGGFNLLFNVDDTSELWPRFRERVSRAIVTKELSRGAISMAKAMYKVALPNNVLDDDEVLAEKVTQIEGLLLVRALARPKRIYSSILRRESYAYWDSMSSVDVDGGSEMFNLLKRLNLLREPPNGLACEVMDNQAPVRIRQLGVRYASIFKRLVVHKLQSGDMMIFNNVTWCHSTSNWSPGSGVRNVVAAFA